MISNTQYLEGNLPFTIGLLCILYHDQVILNINNAQLQNTITKHTSIKASSLFSFSSSMSTYFELNICVLCRFPSMIQLLFSRWSPLYSENTEKMDENFNEVVSNAQYIDILNSGWVWDLSSNDIFSGSNNNCLPWYFDQPVESKNDK